MHSQGGVKLPTGGNQVKMTPGSPRAAIIGDSRFGEKPKPTVKVRMKEKGCNWQIVDCGARSGAFVM